MSVWTDPYGSAEAGRLSPAATRSRGRQAALMRGVDERLPVRASDTLASKGTWESGNDEGSTKLPDTDAD